MTTQTRLGALGLLALAAGCNSGDLTNNQSLSPMFDRDVALVAADAAAEDVELMGGPGGAFGFAFGSVAAAPADARFHCTSKTRFGLTVTRTCSFLDASGAEQDGYDAMTTATIMVSVTIQGTITRERWEADINRAREFTVSGLEGQEAARTWNGTGNGTVSRVRHRDDGETRQYEMVYAAVATDVVIPVPRTDDSWPTSGTITREVQVTISGGEGDGRVVERLVSITFNGTQFVPVTINGTTYIFDLATRRIVDES